jgi:hypothetical protein
MTWNSLTNLAHEQLVTETNMDQIRENLEHIGAMKIGASALSAISQGTLLAGSGFMARKTATQSITGGVTTKIAWDAEDYDPENAFDLTNERYIAPSTGRYLFTYRLTTVNDAQISFVAYYVNGAEVYRFGQAGSGGNPALGSILLNLAANDYVELFVQKGATQNINSASNITWWCGAKVGLA